jgi:hypothetical protein
MNKRFVTIAVTLAVLASAIAPAAAGVVITETESMVSGAPGGQTPPPRQRTIMIEGKKQKMVLDGGRSVVFDIEKNTMDIMDPTQKSYIEMPFPPHGPMAQSIAGPGMRIDQFTKAGTSRTVAGYKCEDYKGSGKMPMGDMSMVDCVSAKAPGAAEYTAFQSAMMAKLKESQVSLPGKMPDGIPLVQEVTTKFGNINMPNLPPAAQEQLKKQLANRPPMVSRTEVSKIETKKIADSEFAIPAGFTKRDMGMRTGMGRPGMSGAPGGHAMMGPPPGAGGAPAAGASPAAKP